MGRGLGIDLDGVAFKGHLLRFLGYTIYKAIELSSLRSYSIERRNIGSIACPRPSRVWSSEAQAQDWLTLRQHNRPLSPNINSAAGLRRATLLMNQFRFTRMPSIGTHGW